MFSKAKKKQDAGLLEVDDLPPAPEPQAVRKASAKPAPRPKSSRPPAGVPSLISADVVIRGVIESDGEVQFDGEIEGDIRAKGLIIGEGARVSGEVVAEKVRVCGTVEGAIRATRVELASGALVRGDVMHTALAIEAGAKFEGNVRHSDDPIGEAGLVGASARPPAAPAPAPMPTPEPAPALSPVAEEAGLAVSEPLARTLPPRGATAKADLR